MVDFLLLEVIQFLQFLDLGDLHANIVDLDAEIGEILVDTIKFDLLCFINEFSEGGESPLNGLDSHVVVHLLPHES